MLDFLRDNPQFQAIRVMVQGNPQILQPMLAELQRQNPQLYHLINANQEEFLALLNEPLPDNIQEIMADFGGEGGVPELDGEGEGGVQIELTAEERDTVDRLVGLGFPLEICVEAYLACDKNESLAANLLFDGFGGGGPTAVFPDSPAAAPAPAAAAPAPAPSDAAAPAPAPKPDDDDDMYS